MRNLLTYNGLYEVLKENEKLKKENEELKIALEYNKYKGLNCTWLIGDLIDIHVNLKWYLERKYDYGHEDEDGHICYDFDFIDKDTKKQFYIELCNVIQEYIESSFLEHNDEFFRIDAFDTLFSEYVDCGFIKLKGEHYYEKKRKEIYWLLEKKKAFNKIQNLIMLENYI
jgi:hypothetical protein